tara:strand:+ start:249 stop:416 length:168 start_codon:yes stop_codon:yes gene_type:complete
MILMNKEIVDQVLTMSDWLSTISTVMLHVPSQPVEDTAADESQEPRYDLPSATDP